MSLEIVDFIQFGDIADSRVDNDLLVLAPNFVSLASSIAVSAGVRILDQYGF
jgi:hypothetical protein